MPIYNDNKMFVQTYRFDQLFEDDPAWDGNTYANKYQAFLKAVQDFGSDLFPAPIVEADVVPLLDLLYRKYAFSHIRYTDGVAFLVGLMRKLHYVWPLYNEQHTLLTQIYGTPIAEIQRDLMTVHNVINNPNDPVITPSETPIPNLSSQQETMLQLSGKLGALQMKMNALKVDVDAKFFKELDPLFSVILSQDIEFIY